MEIATVNVIDMRNGTIQSISSWPDTREGNAAAEQAFCDLVGSIAPNASLTREDFDNLLENGWYEIGDGAIYIAHSSGESHPPKRKLLFGTRRQSPYTHTPLGNVVGKTIEVVSQTTVEGSDGDEPCLMFGFTDGTEHGVVMPREEGIDWSK